MRPWFNPFIGLVTAMLLSGVPASATVAETPPPVVLIVNEAVPGSLDVAQAYQKARGVPDNQVIRLRTATGAGVSRAAFNTEIANPILRALEERKFITAFLDEPKAEGGRLEVDLISSRVRYLVLCYGMPWRIHGVEAPGDEAAVAQAKQLYARQGVRGGALNQFFSGPIGKNEASVDGDLSVLLFTAPPITGALPNPLLRRAELRNALPEILRVTRLDGPTVEDAKQLIVRAQAGERDGLRGRAYFDLDKRGGNFQAGDDWVEGAYELATRLGFSTDIDRQRSLWPLSARADAPAIYFGWYTRNVSGPFKLRNFRFAPGAVAAHLHSFSAQRLRNPELDWVGPLIKRGVAATVGNVHEPYLMLTHNFDALLAGLAEGWHWADAAYFALPALSWQAVVIGDPLYRPFTQPLEAQVAAAEGQGSDPYAAYAVIREMNRLVAADQPAAARRAGLIAWGRSLHPALGLRLAQLDRASGETGAAQRRLERLARLRPAGAQQWGLWVAIAEELTALAGPAAALPVWQTLLEDVILPAELAKVWLPPALASAESAGNMRQVIRWRERLTELTAPPPEEATPVEP